MKDLVCVKVLQAKAHFKEEFPNDLLLKHLSHLPFQVETEISLFAVLHDDIELLCLFVQDSSHHIMLGLLVIVLHYVRMVQLLKNVDLADDLVPLSFTHTTIVQLFPNQDLAI